MRGKSCRVARTLSCSEASKLIFSNQANAPWTVGKCRSTVILRRKFSTSPGSSDVQYVVLLDSCNMSSLITPNFSPVIILEKVVLEHHQRRRDLADCIQFLLEAAEMVGTLGTSALHARLELFVKQRLIPLKEGANGPVVTVWSLERRASVGRCCLRLKLLIRLYISGAGCEAERWEQYNIARSVVLISHSNHLTSSHASSTQAPALT